MACDSFFQGIEKGLGTSLQILEKTRPTALYSTVIHNILAIKTKHKLLPFVSADLIKEQAIKICGYLSSDT